MTPAPPLLITRDDRLLDDLHRLAAAAGTTLDVAHDPVDALRGWTAAPVVLVGADLVAGVADQRPPRRDRVHVVGSGPAGDGLFRSALAAGAVDVVELPAADSWLVEVLTDAADGETRRSWTVGVVAGSGGAGATTFACALALTAAARAPALLVDLDPVGPGLDGVVGLDPSDGAAAGAFWGALVGSRGRLGSRSLREALPTKGALAVVTWAPGRPAPLDAPSVREVLSAGQRGHDLVVVDLPRTLDDVTAEVVARCDRVLLVAEPTLPSVASSGRVASVVEELNPDLGLVLRGSSASVPAAQVARTLALPLVTQAGYQRRLAEHLDLGLGPVHSRRAPLARAARSVLDRIDVDRIEGGRIDSGQDAS